MQTEKKKFDVYSISLHAILVVFAAIIVFLVLEIKSMSNTDSGRPKIEQAEPGEKYADIPVLKTDSTETTIDLTSNGKDKLLFIFSTECPHCTKNIPYWNKIYDKFSESINIYSVSYMPYGRVLPYISQFEISYPVFIAKSSTFRKEYKIAGVPQTILFSDSGVVKDLWIGALNDERFEEVIGKIN
jgi:hypothetical protein